MPYVAEILKPYEAHCPECHGSGFLDEKGQPWEGDVYLPPSYTDPYQKCWNTDCREGIILTDEGKALLAFLKRHLRVKADSELTMT